MKTLTCHRLLLKQQVTTIITTATRFSTSQKKRNRRKRKRNKRRRQKQQESISNEKEGAVVAPRENTAGRNTYLKVVLNDEDGEIYHFLRDMTLRIQHQVEIMQADFQREQKEQQQDDEDEQQGDEEKEEDEQQDEEEQDEQQDEQQEEEALPQQDEEVQDEQQDEEEQDEQQEQGEEAQHASLQTPEKSSLFNDNNTDEVLDKKKKRRRRRKRKRRKHKKSLSVNDNNIRDEVVATAGLNDVAATEEEQQDEEEDEEDEEKQDEEEEEEAQQASLQPPEKSSDNNTNDEILDKKKKRRRKKKRKRRKRKKSVNDNKNRDEATTLNDDAAAANKAIGHKQKPSKKKKNYDNSLLRIKPRSKLSHHMIFFFAGEVICELPESELQQWYNDVKDCLDRVHFRPMTTSSTPTDDDDDIPATQESNKVDESNNDNDGETHFFPTQFKLQKICVFPPERDTLIVAVLEVPSEWNTLHQNIYKLALDNTYDSIGLREVVKTKGKTGKWIAHITLANIITTRDTNKREWIREFIRSRLTPYLDSLLQESTMTTSNDADNAEKKDCVENESKTTIPFSTNHVVTVKSISLGGCQPQQIQGLDWDFIYQGATKPTNNENDHRKDTGMK